jgi:hypothetical protein
MSKYGRTQFLFKQCMNSFNVNNVWILSMLLYVLLEWFILYCWVSLWKNACCGHASFSTPTFSRTSSRIKEYSHEHARESRENQSAKYRQDMGDVISNRHLLGSRTWIWMYVSMSHYTCSDILYMFLYSWKPKYMVYNKHENRIPWNSYIIHLYIADI